MATKKTTPKTPAVDPIEESAPVIDTAPALVTETDEHALWAKLSEYADRVARGYNDQ